MINSAIVFCSGGKKAEVHKILLSLEDTKQVTVLVTLQCNGQRVINSLFVYICISGCSQTFLSMVTSVWNDHTCTLLAHDLIVFRSDLGFFHMASLTLLVRMQ